MINLFESQWQFQISLPRIPLVRNLILYTSRERYFFVENKFAQCANVQLVFSFV